MFIEQKNLLLISLLFLFQWIWGPNHVYALETSKLDCKMSKNHIRTSSTKQVLDSKEKNLGGRSSWLFHNDLLEHEEWILLKGLDSLCADTWCEGSFDFQFSGFKCSFKEHKCVMFYKSWDQETKSITTLRPFSFICVIKAMDRKTLFGTELDFWISPYLYLAVTECIAEGEHWVLSNK